MAKRVSIFVTCVVDQLFPAVGLAMTDVLERLGYQIDFPEDQTCCGQPAFNTGYRDEARQVARHFLKVFRDAEYVVVPSGSCTSMIAHHFHDLFPEDAEPRHAAEALAPRVWEFSKFLLEIAGVEDVGARLEDVVTYHDSCHALREFGIKEGPRRLLKNVRGLELREMDAAEECCGFGGTFLGEAARNFRRHGAHQARFHHAHGRPDGSQRGLQLPDADPRCPLARAVAGAYPAPGGGVGEPLSCRTNHVGRIR